MTAQTRITGPAPEMMAVEHWPVSRLRPFSHNARVHSKKQIRQIADSIKKFGFTNPVLISDDDEIIAGHGRVEAARLLGMETVPTLRLSHLDATQRRANWRSTPAGTGRCLPSNCRRWLMPHSTSR